MRQTESLAGLDYDVGYKEDRKEKIQIETERNRDRNTRKK
jgi:hypothetical protein